MADDWQAPRNSHAIQEVLCFPGDHNAIETQNIDSSNNITSNKTEASKPTKSFIQCMTGISCDIRARVPLFCTFDWGRPRSLTKVLNATVFAFVVQLIPVLIFAELMDKQTKQWLSSLS